MMRQKSGNIINMLLLLVYMVTPDSVTTLHQRQV